MSPRREIIKMIEKNAHRHGAHQVFGDFVQMGAIAISNAVDLRQREPRESRYLELVKRYDRDEVERFSHMLALLVLELEAEPADVLGTIYMEMELSNSRAGQFFTPYPLCRAMARMQIDGRMRAIIAERGHITVNDPAVGGGALIIAMAHELQLSGINYQLHMHATVQDLDYRAACMAYLQLSLLHIPAVVVRGNTLTCEVAEAWYTPAHIMGGWNWKLRGKVQSVHTESKIKTHKRMPAQNQQAAIFV